MYRYKNLHFRFSVDTCTSTFVTANIFPWYLLIRENFANEAVQYIGLVICIVPDHAFSLVNRYGGSGGTYR